jgi:hypothetical protein
VQVVIPVKGAVGDELLPELRKLLSPFGSITRVKDSLIVLDKAGSISNIHDLLQKIDARNKDPNHREAPFIHLDRDGWADLVVDSQPELRRYVVAPGNADALSKSLLAVNPKLRLIPVQSANEVWVMATPQEHAALATWFKLVAPKRESGNER